MSETFNPFSLEGKTILVTGASSGIGRAIAIVCSKMGANVVLTARNKERLNQTLEQMSEGNHHVISADMTVSEDIDRIAADCPSLNGIVHCAGVGDRTLLKMVREKDIDRVMKANFDAPVLLQRALLKKKKVQHEASIVFIASRAPFAPAPGNGIYAASKGALLAYAKVLGLELASQKIRVNSVCPAMVWTDLVQRDAEINGVDYSQVEQSYPLKRFGKPEDVANLVVYLLSDASEWMTGSSIDITGGGEFTLS
ncbi:MAG: SDR family oxidoreductase [Prevotella sp.]|nr:SDR family oxidoreductase [Bacteroides sp.]MCM1366404.1 SDR family oxidoreductase [Prevotella sp.]MCM1436667.1 SDR family oxidoreductase [Prevotella sp.]